MRALHQLEVASTSASDNCHSNSRAATLCPVRPAYRQGRQRIQSAHASIEASETPTACHRQRKGQGMKVVVLHPPAHAAPCGGGSGAAWRHPCHLHRACNNGPAAAPAPPLAFDATCAKRRHPTSDCSRRPLGPRGKNGIPEVNGERRAVPNAVAAESRRSPAYDAATW